MARGLAIGALVLSGLAAAAAGAALVTVLGGQDDRAAQRIKVLEDRLAEAEDERGRLFRQFGALQKKIASARTVSPELLAAEIAALRSSLKPQIGPDELDLLADKLETRLARTLGAGAQPITQDRAAPQSPPADAQMIGGLAFYGLDCRHERLDVICRFQISSTGGGQSAVIPRTLGMMATKPLRCVSVDNAPCRDTPHLIRQTQPTVVAFAVPSFEYAPRLIETLRLDLGGSILEWSDIPIAGTAGHGD